MSVLLNCDSTFRLHRLFKFSRILTPELPTAASYGTVWELNRIKLLTDTERSSVERKLTSQVRIHKKSKTTLIPSRRELECRGNTCKLVHLSE